MQERDNVTSWDLRGIPAWLSFRNTLFTKKEKRIKAITQTQLHAGEIQWTTCNKKANLLNATILFYCIFCFVFNSHWFTVVLLIYSHILVDITQPVINQKQKSWFFAKTCHRHNPQYGQQFHRSFIYETANAARIFFLTHFLAFLIVVNPELEVFHHPLFSLESLKLYIISITHILHFFSLRTKNRAGIWLEFCYTYFPLSVQFSLCTWN